MWAFYCDHRSSLYPWLQQNRISYHFIPCAGRRLEVRLMHHIASVILIVNVAVAVVVPLALKLLSHHFVKWEKCCDVRSMNSKLSHSLISLRAPLTFCLVLVSPPWHLQARLPPSFGRQTEQWQLRRRQHSTATRLVQWRRGRWGCKL